MSLLAFLDDEAVIPEPASAERARAGLAAWQAAAAGLGAADAAFADALVAEPRGRAFLEGVLGNSPHLGQSLARAPDQLRTMAERGPAAAFENAVADVSGEACWRTERGPAAARLRAAKRRASLTVALADIAGAWELDAVTRALTRFADAALASALDHVLHRAAERGVLSPPDRANPARESGLAVLGMGKLGARELNYSSDVDLIVLFDPKRVRHRGPDGPAQDLHRLVRDFIALLSERTNDGYVYRTDLRLRPDTGATPLAVSTVAAEQYYETLGQNWERAAMIKARPVAGDAAVGAGMLKRLHPFVWRKHLDFAAIQDIQSIKRQIDARPGRRGIDAAGHDVKLGPGGIREIEFYAQTQQLVWGGRDSSLRPRATCDALRALAAAGRMDETAARELVASYAFLRRLEHRLQMVADEQTHALPEDGAGLAALARFMGFADAAALADTLRAHSRRVEGYYAALFEGAPALGGADGNLVFTGTDDDPDTLVSLERMGFGDGPAVSAAVRGWHHGRIRATRSARARELLTELMPALLGALAGTASPDAAFRKFDEFLGKLPSGVQLFSLFHANPGLLARLAEIMGSAPRIAEHLSRRPSLLEGLLAGASGGPAPAPDALLDDLRRALAPAGDFQDVLDGVRRWQHDREFAIGMRILQGDVPAERSAEALSDLADAVLAGLLPRVEEEFARGHGAVPGGRFAVIGMGKLGSREMTFESDLDIVFLYDAPEGFGAVSDGPRGLAASHYYARLGQRMASAVSALTAEGRLYAVDTRLRPSGEAGPIATEIDAFRRYQENDAWTWEHMALTRARPVAGDPGLRAAAMAGIRAVLTAPRDADALLADVAAMRERVDGERHTENPWRLKHVRGGLLDLEFIAQYHLLRHAARCPAILVQSTRAMFGRLGEAGLLDAAEAAALVEATAFLQRLQGLLRLTVGTNREAGRFSTGVRDTLSRAMGAEGFAALEARLAAIQDRVRAGYDRLLAAPAAALHRKREGSDQ